MMQPWLCAAQRFGLGAKAGSDFHPVDDPRGYLSSQISTKKSLPPQLQGLRSAQESFANYLSFRSIRKTYLDAVFEKNTDKARGIRDSPAYADNPIANFDRELNARVELAIATDSPFVERMAMHWLNVLTVSVKNARLVPFAGAYEREVIRTHMFGNFADLLGAAVLHPAMLFYLDGHTSVGPNSKVGLQSRRFGFNENLGREILELHALGVDGGYTQDDVTELSKILTGWTVRTEGLTSTSPDFVVFDPDRHEPGERRLLGKRYPEDGEDQARAALRDLARHPSAARHVAHRLAEHFVGTPPPGGLVDALTKAYRDTDGDLATVTRALIAHSAAWEEPARKVRSPMEFLLATSRILERVPHKPMIALRAMGQPYFAPPAPKGWPQEDEVWAAPDTIKTRVDWTIQMSRRLPAEIDARRLAETSFGDELSGETRQAIDRAASGSQALALFLMSPEFQRR